jgi:hypothetical protein
MAARKKSTKKAATVCPSDPEDARTALELGVLTVGALYRVTRTETDFDFLEGDLLRFMSADGRRYSFTDEAGSLVTVVATEDQLSSILESSDRPRAAAPAEELEGRDNACRTCGAKYADGGDGFDGECPSCADRRAAAAEENGTSTVETVTEDPPESAAPAVEPGKRGKRTKATPKTKGGKKGKKTPQTVPESAPVEASAEAPAAAPEPSQAPAAQVETGDPVLEAGLEAHVAAAVAAKVEAIEVPKTDAWEPDILFVRLKGDIVALVAAGNVAEAVRRLKLALCPPEAKERKPREPKAPKVDGPCKCPVCGAGSGNRQGVVAHLRTKHGYTREQWQAAMATPAAAA